MPIIDKLLFVNKPADEGRKWGGGAVGVVESSAEGYCADNRLTAFFVLFLLLRLMMKVGGGYCADNQ